jgi:hypothetical protein
MSTEPKIEPKVGLEFDCQPPTQFAQSSDKIALYTPASRFGGKSRLRNGLKSIEKE